MEKKKWTKEIIRIFLHLQYRQQPNITINQIHETKKTTFKQRINGGEIGNSSPTKPLGLEGVSLPSFR